MKPIKIKRLWNNCASIRDYVVNKAIKDNETIMVTVNGLAGCMILKPDDLMQKSFAVLGQKFVSKFGDKKYKLIDFPWKPSKTPEGLQERLKI